MKTTVALRDSYMSAFANGKGLSVVFFGISLPSVVLRSRTDKFEEKFSLCGDFS